MNKNELLRIIYEQKDYNLAERLCSKKSDAENKLLLARILFYNHKFSEAGLLFGELNKLTEYGYCRLYQGDKVSADSIWFSLEDESPLIMWAKALSGYLDNVKRREPTFFQIRNFYEIDLDRFLSLQMTNYAENLINSIQYFADVNLELYKFTARVLFNHEYYSLSERFIDAAKRNVFEDPEIHYIEAELRLKQNQKLSAIKSLSTILEIEPEYYPAKRLLKTLK